MDRLRFNQIFFNLLSNAAKFTQEGGNVSFWVETSLAEEGRVRLLFHVKDNGIGISEGVLPHLYDPFSQEKTKLNAATTGTGLGLPIVKSLVDAMGGTIRAMKREDAAAVPIIAMTADAFDEEQKTTLAAGMNCHLSKPIDPVILYQTLAEYTGRSRKEKENKKRTQA